MLDEKKVDFNQIWNSLPETNQLTIKHLQRRRKHTELKIEMSVMCKNKALITSYKKIWTELNEELQDIWGIPRDHKMHKFWQISGCTCPKTDNDERHGANCGHLINGACPIHGIEQLKWEEINDEWLEETK